MKSLRRQNNSMDAKGDGNQVLALALFIMLLAFFIVLSTLSSFQEEKIESIMGSIEDTFATQVDSIYLRRPSVSSFSADASKNGEANRLEELEALFNSQITALSMEVDAQKGTMWVQVEYENFYKALTALKRGATSEETGEERDENPFLPTLISLLNTNNNNTVYRMDMILNMDETPVTVRDNDLSSFIADRNRVGLLSRLLEEAGLPARQMSIGLSKGSPNTLDLVFRPYRVFDTLEERKGVENTNNNANTSPVGGVL